MTVAVILMRIYLLAGLIAHKVIWEVMKRRQRGPNTAAPPLPLRTRLVKSIKLLILAGIVAQTLIPDNWMAPLLLSPDPLLLRWIGVLIFTGGWWLAVLGRTQLGTNWSDIETAEVLTRQRVVSHGVYRYIRHPIYVGDLLLLLGLELALNSWLVIGVLLLMPIVLRQAIREEGLLRRELEGYDEYCTVTKRFVPFIA